MDGCGHLKSVYWSTLEERLRTGIKDWKLILKKYSNFKIKILENFLYLIHKKVYN